MEWIEWNGEPWRETANAVLYVCLRDGREIGPIHAKHVTTFSWSVYSESHTDVIAISRHVPTEPTTEQSEIVPLDMSIYRTSSPPWPST